MGKEKFKTHASNEAMRWQDDGGAAEPTQGPSEEGNVFDIRMRDEADGLAAAKKIVAFIKEKGHCVVEANAPQALLEAAHYEAEQLWEDSKFGPPLRVSDDRSYLEAQMWHQVLKDEEKIFWVKQESGESTNALKLLAQNMSDFAGGLGELLRKELSLEFDRIGQPMLSCYTGDRQYAFHLDNPHGGDESEEEEKGTPDNGIRLTATYYLNPHWDPKSGNHGGLDMFLTNPKETPSPSKAKEGPKLRIAPHADTLVLYLSERMAHQIVETKGEDKWFALNLWCLNGGAMQSMAKKIVARRNKANKQDSDSD